MSTQKTDLSDISYASLPAEIQRFRKVILVIVIAVLASYFVWFALILSGSLSVESASWGQFGDFVGGLLNPLIAYAAFHWITRSVLIQGQELSETRAALRDSARAQESQANHAKLTAQIGTLQSLVQALTSDIEFARKDQEYIGRQLEKNGTQYISYALNGKKIPGSEVPAYLETLSQEVREISARRKELINTLNEYIVRVQA